MPLLRLHSPAEAADWLRARVRGTLHADSRAVRAGDGFLAWPGSRSDARSFVGMALDAGAVACLVDDSGAEAFGFDDARIAALPGLKSAAGAIADAVLGQPSAQLDVLAVTGTNGKTSTAWWLAQALALNGRRCGVMGTLGVGEPPLGGAADAPAAAAAPARLQLQATGLTTPDAVTVHTTLRCFADAGLQACALEASSIGLVDHRLSAVRIDVALFTNLTRDHLDYHGDMAAYWAAKRSLFSWPGLRAAVVNIDDAQGAALAAELQGAALDLWTVSCTGPARLRAHALRHEAAGMAFDLVEEGASAQPVQTPLVGGYNASNLLVVAAGLRALGLPLADVAASLGRLQPVPGRLQRVDADAAADETTDAAADVHVLVDYAHTPDALEKVLQALRPLATARGGQLVCVFGCGGNRDATKRPLMGRIAEQLADRVVLTSDNPRFEAPAAILAEIVAGLQRPAAATVIEDRQAAIVHAVVTAHPGDVVLLAGKGHEEAQDVAGVKRPFSDLAEARAALRQRQLQAAGAAA
jgi:UDP-N-acetylmuramoyl-L-alanyl-D-glutamate--2,6-diaminopimelate ligase